MTNEQLEKALRIMYEEIKLLKIKVKNLEEDYLEDTPDIMDMGMNDPNQEFYDMHNNEENE